MNRVGPLPSEVVILRSGYATEDLWWKSINDALRYGRDVHAIDGQGRSVHYRAADGLIDLPEVPDW